MKLETTNSFQEFEGFLKNENNSNRLIVERTVSYLNWRFSKILGNYQILAGKSTSTNEIIGYAVTKKTNIGKLRNVLDIVDLHALPMQERCVNSMIDESLRTGKAENVDLIHFRVPVGIVMQKHSHAKDF